MTQKNCVLVRSLTAANVRSFVHSSYQVFCKGLKTQFKYINL